MIRPAVVALAALLVAPLALAEARAQDRTSLRLSLDWRIEGPAAPVLLAQDRGFFAEEGLDVTIEPGLGSADTATRVATGAYDLALGDLNSLIRFKPRDGETRPVAIFILHEQPAFAVIGRRSRGVSEDPRSLEGKALGAPRADGAFAQWPLFAKASGIDAARVKIINIAVPVREPMLAAGEVDAVTGYIWSGGPDLRSKGVPAGDIVVLPMARGLPLYGNAVLAAPALLKDDPEAVRGFLRALTKGIQAAVADPAAAIDSLMRRTPDADRQAERARLAAALEGSIATPAVRADGLGTADPGRLAASIALIGETTDLDRSVTPETVFDPAFLPPEAERRLD